LDTVFSDVDPDTLDGPAPGGVGDGFDGATYFRRARIYLQGDVTPYVDYKIQIDFADPTDPQFRDAYITLKNLKDCLGCWVPSIRAGHQYDPIGLETTSSSNNNAFIERSLTTNLHPERQIGLNFLDSFWKERATAQLGIFATNHPTDDEDGFGLWDEDEADGGYAVTGRFTVIPWAKDQCRFLHVGASGSYRNPNQYRYRARPGLGRGERMVDTTAFNDPDEIIVWNAELGLVWNSFWITGEYTNVDVSDDLRGDPSFTAWYVQAGCFLTGESKAYNWKGGVWAGNKPCCNFLDDECCCKGAWELIARYDTLDLNDGTIQGGEMTNITVGVNWYWNPWFRIMFNYVMSNTEDRASGGITIPDGDVNSFLMRWDIHF
jgi:phosphate-selective porin OprO/OprP